MLRILGIDPGLTHTGVGVIDFDGVKASAIHHEIISSTVRSPVYERLAKIHNRLSEIINAYSPDESAQHLPPSGGRLS